MAVPSTDKAIKMPHIPGVYEVAVSAPEGRWQARIIGGPVFLKGSKTSEGAKAKAGTFFMEQLTPWTEESE